MPERMWNAFQHPRIFKLKKRHVRYNNIRGMCVACLKEFLFYFKPKSVYTDYMYKQYKFWSWSVLFIILLEERNFANGELISYQIR